jgi:hypothetical protein
MMGQILNITFRIYTSYLLCNTNTAGGIEIEIQDYSKAQESEYSSEIAEQQS